MGDALWRVGKKLGRTLYRDEVFMGILDSPEVAAEIVATLNGRERTLGPMPRLNKPMVEQLRRCAADTSSNWDGAITVYPPGARGLVALIDWVNGWPGEHPSIPAENGRERSPEPTSPCGCPSIHVGHGILTAHKPKCKGEDAS